MRSLWVLCLASAAMLSSCGEVCLGPFGGCYESLADGSTATTTFHIAVPTTLTPFVTLAPGDTVELSAVGGVGTYTWSKTSGVGTLTDGASNGSATYTAPATPLAANPSNVVIQVQDSNLQRYSVSFTTIE